MSSIYVTENAATIGLEGNRIYVKYKDGEVKTVPIQTIDCINVLGKNQVTL